MFAEFAQALQKEWCNIPQIQIRKLIRHKESVISLNGCYTKSLFATSSKMWKCFFDNCDDVRFGLVWFVGFYGISTFVGYLTPNPVLFQTTQLSMSTQLVKNISISNNSVCDYVQYNEKEYLFLITLTSLQIDKLTSLQNYH